MPRPNPTLAVLVAVAGALTAWSTGVLAQPTAEYTVQFDATWSAQTHPVGFPSNPHFSGLIGGTHNDQVIFWEVGQLASPGIKSMAETGSKSLLQAEVQAAIGAGTADVVISGGGIGSSPGTVSETFTIDESYPLVTLVSMLAPSPDWFVGTTGVSLRENDQWLNTKVVELVVYDAGTDSGVNYNSPNNPTVPPVPIFENMEGPFASNNVVGTFTFTRSTVGVEGGGAPVANQLRLVPLGPNPLQGTGRFEVHVPGGTTSDLSIYDVTGRMIRSLLRDATADPQRVVVWDGRDDRGGRVAAGVYFVALHAGDVSRTHKILLAR